jgi:hypothetical protein
MRKSDRYKNSLEQMQNLKLTRRKISLYVHFMSKYDSPALLDPALFWGVVAVIFLYLHKSRKGKKEKEGQAAWHNLFRNWHDLFSFFLRGFYDPNFSSCMYENKRIYTPSLTPALLRAFA